MMEGAQLPSDRLITLRESNESIIDRAYTPVDQDSWLCDACNMPYHSHKWVANVLTENLEPHIVYLCDGTLAHLQFKELT